MARQRRTLPLAESRNDVRKKKEAVYETNLRTAVRQCTLGGLDNEARAVLLPRLVPVQESGASRVLEDFPDPLTGPC